MKRTALIIFCMLISLAFASGCSTKTANELVVGMELAYPPFETTDEAGKPSGISVEMAYALGEYLNRPVRIENMAYQGLVPALKTGKADIIISSMTITEERKLTVNFSDPYAKSFLTMLVYKDSPVEQFEDLKQPERKVAVKKGTTGHFYALENLDEKQVVVFDKESACVLEVSQGKADAFLYDALTVYRNAEKYKETTRTVFTPFQDEFEYWGIAVKKEDEELLKKVNEFIKQYNESGEMNKLADKYLGDIKKVFDDQGLDFFFDID